MGNDDKKPFNRDTQKRLLKDVVSKDMAETGFKVLSFAYKDMPL